MNPYNVTAILTCFNRKDKTVRCVKSLVSGNPDISFHFIVVDDNSTDGTVDALQAIEDADITILKGTGNLFWCGGMRKAIEFFLNSDPEDEDYCLWVNDDVDFFEHSIENLFLRLNGRSNYIIVGATCNKNGDFTYGLKTKEKWFKKNITKRIYPSKEEIIGKTFNANCVLFKNKVIKKIGNMDSVYKHGLGDYDYGFMLSRNGYKIISTERYVGVCETNQSSGGWTDTSLSRKERIQKKESPKGSPTKEWWHFLLKNFGLISAVEHTVIPYVKILLGK